MSVAPIIVAWNERLQTVTLDRAPYEMAAAVYYAKYWTRSGLVARLPIRNDIPRRVPCDVCGVLCDKDFDWGEVGGMVVYRCAACDPERLCVRAFRPSEAWWLRLLRWAAKL